MNTYTQSGPGSDEAAHSAAQSKDWGRTQDRATGVNGTTEGHSPSHREAVDLRLALLAKAIEHEIIPRLMLAHRNPHECLSLPEVDAANEQVTALDVETFARLVLSDDENLAQACVDAMRLKGIAVETIYLELLAPVARHLGSLWEQDLCDFTEVTIGLGRLHQVLRELSPGFSQPLGHGGTGRRILLLPSPGEQHTFGLVMVSEFFRHAGWDVAGGPWEAGADPVTMVRREWFDVVGFSLGSELHLDELAQCIRSVRKAAINRQVGIMVGGPIFTLHPEYVSRVGADGAASDGRRAPDIAEQLSAGRKAN
jgi:MerR family transcriptional regulator, light-induced transcriptional regulator